ncbi:MAG: RdgB/HAM1 family non-canonical purine NTP pyrophosphatase [Chloroflexi bacterium]|nr:RdgB/HAM1 family non-canonical purine NTP pyrophosphatase [Chloroflexota bacterium]MYD47107.1 RdgB/HAM1 family non-canonical purine NTP pyrophosphatase [Chloroflexota bacterium]
MSAPTLLVATRNPGKMREYRELLADYPGRLISLDDAGIPDEVEETGNTFLANAHLKAATYATLSGQLTVSDDSGLEVHALGGAPGVYSARYGGDACHSDADRVDLLLRNLEGIPWERRIARFRCFTAIAAPHGIIATVVGSIAGVIQYEPTRQHGFGYDPVFHLPSYGGSMAELTLEQKNFISHRADAARKVRKILNAL